MSSTPSSPAKLLHQKTKESINKRAKDAVVLEQKNSSTESKPPSDSEKTVVVKQESVTKDIDTLLKPTELNDSSPQQDSIKEEQTPETSPQVENEEGEDNEGFESPTTSRNRGRGRGRGRGKGRVRGRGRGRGRGKGRYVMSDNSENERDDDLYDREDNAGSGHYKNLEEDEDGPRHTLSRKGSTASRGRGRKAGSKRLYNDSSDDDSEDRHYNYGSESGSYNHKTKRSNHPSSTYEDYIVQGDLNDGTTLLDLEDRNYYKHSEYHSPTYKKTTEDPEESVHSPTEKNDSQSTHPHGNRKHQKEGQRNEENEEDDHHKLPSINPPPRNYVLSYPYKEDCPLCKPDYTTINNDGTITVDDAHAIISCIRCNTTYHFSCLNEFIHKNSSLFVETLHWKEDEGCVTVQNIHEWLCPYCRYILKQFNGEIDEKVLAHAKELMSDPISMEVTVEDVPADSEKKKEEVTATATATADSEKKEEVAAPSVPTTAATADSEMKEKVAVPTTTTDSEKKEEETPAALPTDIEMKEEVVTTTDDSEKKEDATTAPTDIEMKEEGVVVPPTDNDMKEDTPPPSTQDANMNTTTSPTPPTETTTPQDQLQLYQFTSSFIKNGQILSFRKNLIGCTIHVLDFINMCTISGRIMYYLDHLLLYYVLFEDGEGYWMCLERWECNIYGGIVWFKYAHASDTQTGVPPQEKMDTDEPSESDKTSTELLPNSKQYGIGQIILKYIKDDPIMNNDLVSIFDFLANKVVYVPKDDVDIYRSKREHLTVYYSLSEQNIEHITNELLIVPKIIKHTREPFSTVPKKVIYSNEELCNSSIYIYTYVSNYPFGAWEKGYVTGYNNNPRKHYVRFYNNNIKSGWYSLHECNFMRRKSINNELQSILSSSDIYCMCCLNSTNTPQNPLHKCSKCNFYIHQLCNIDNGKIKTYDLNTMTDLSAEQVATDYYCFCCHVCQGCGKRFSLYNIWYQLDISGKVILCCNVCLTKYQQKQYCGLCRKTYMNSTDMLLCQECGLYIHLNCETKTVRDYYYHDLKKEEEEEEEEKKPKSEKLLPLDHYFCMKCRKNKLNDVLVKLKEIDVDHIFVKPVDEKDAHDYYNVISHKDAMCFDSMADKIKQKEYPTIQSFYDDFELMCLNSYIYNNIGDPVWKATDNLNKKGKELLFKVFPFLTKSKFDQDIQQVKERRNQDLNGVQPSLVAQVNSMIASTRQHQLEKVKDDIGKLGPKTPVPYSPSEEVYKVAILEKYKSIIPKDMCMICGSTGDQDQMLFCMDCGEAYHANCYNSRIIITETMRYCWRCLNCAICECCGERIQLTPSQPTAAGTSGDSTTSTVPGSTTTASSSLVATAPSVPAAPINDYIVCDECGKYFHIKCLVPVPKNPLKDMFYCYTCYCCKKCKRLPPKYSYSFKRHYCSECAETELSFKICPICNKKWDPSDNNMYYCDKCEHWIHKECTGLTSNDFFKLDFYNQNYICRLCAQGKTNEYYHNPLVDYPYVPVPSENLPANDYLANQRMGQPFPYAPAQLTAFGKSPDLYMMKSFPNGVDLSSTTVRAPPSIPISLQSAYGLNMNAYGNPSEYTSLESSIQQQVRSIQELRQKRLSAMNSPQNRDDTLRNLLLTFFYDIAIIIYKANSIVSYTSTLNISQDYVDEHIKKRVEMFSNKELAQNLYQRAQRYLSKQYHRSTIRFTSASSSYTSINTEEILEQFPNENDINKICPSFSEQVVKDMIEYYNHDILDMFNDCLGASAYLWAVYNLFPTFFDPNCPFTYFHLLLISTPFLDFSHLYGQVLVPPSFFNKLTTDYYHSIIHPLSNPSLNMNYFQMYLQPYQPYPSALFPYFNPSLAMLQNSMNANGDVLNAATGVPNIFMNTPLESMDPFLQTSQVYSSITPQAIHKTIPVDESMDTQDLKMNGTTSEPVSAVADPAMNPTTEGASKESEKSTLHATEEVTMESSSKMDVDSKESTTELPPSSLAPKPEHEEPAVHTPTTESSKSPLQEEEPMEKTIPPPETPEGLPTSPSVTETPMVALCKTLSKDHTIVKALTCLPGHEDDEDPRECVFCGIHGDTNRAGRMLPLNSGEWAHANCCIWMNGMNEDFNACLIKISNNIRKDYKNINCCYCGRPNANIHCKYPDCTNSFHFECGLDHKCMFMLDKQCFCHEHVPIPLSPKTTMKSNDLYSSTLSPYDPSLSKADYARTRYTKMPSLLSKSSPTTYYSQEARDLTKRKEQKKKIRTCIHYVVLFIS